MTEETLAIEGLLERLRGGDQAAAAEIFNRFSRRLIGLARRQLDTELRRKVGAEDVVQSVFRSYFARHLEEQFEVRDWDSLWSLLALITVRKCTNVRVSFRRQARNLNREIYVDSAVDGDGGGWAALAREPTPADAVLFNELVETMLNELPAREQRIVALSLEGQDTCQIGDAIGRAERTVRRVLEQFRQRLEQAALED